MAAAIGLVVLTAVVLGSALLRLRLYQEAYGWTELRFYVLAAILWLAIGCVLAVLSLGADRSHWLLHAMVAVSIVFGLAFNVIGPVRLVAEQNVERAVHPELVAPGGETGLDLAYLGTLGDDALPVLVENLCRLPGPGRRPPTREGLDRGGGSQRGWEGLAGLEPGSRTGADLEVPELCLLSTN